MEKNTQKSNVGKQVIIAGCGETGNLLGQKLIDYGFSVWGIRRNIKLLANNIKPISNDLSSQSNLKNWPHTSIRYLVYCVSADSSCKDDYNTAYVISLQNVLRKLHSMRYPISRIFFISSTSVYHHQLGEWVSELSATHPSTVSGQIMLEAESIALHSRFPCTNIRFGAIYGPKRRYLIDSVLKHRGYSPHTKQYGNRIHIDDCAEMLCFLIKKDLQGNLLENCYLGVDSHPTYLNEITTWLAQQLNIQIEDYSLPYRSGNKRCSNNKIIQLGYSFLYPSYKEGFESILRTC